MAFTIQGPHPALAVSSILPNPQLGDSIAPTGSITFKRAMDGTKYAYVISRNARKKFIWNFSISMHKALEMQAYFEAYGSDEALITDHLGKAYIGNFTINPFEFEATRRALVSPGNDTKHQLQLEFEGFEQP